VSLVALYLGHESIETTHIYLEADLTLKAQAISKAAPQALAVALTDPAMPC